MPRFLAASAARNVAIGKVVYAANFFEPKLWVNGGNKKLAYGGTYRCCDVTQKDACDHFHK